MNYQTILVPGVAWPEYKPKLLKVKKKGCRRIDTSVTAKVQEHIANNPGQDADEITTALTYLAPAKTIVNSLNKLWATNRLESDLVWRRGRRVRLYRLGPKA